MPAGLTCSKFWDQQEGCPAAFRRFRKTNISSITPCSLYSCPMVCCDHIALPPKTCQQLLLQETPLEPACGHGKFIIPDVVKSKTPTACSGKDDCQSKCCKQPTPSSCADLGKMVVPICPLGLRLTTVEEGDIKTSLKATSGSKSASSSFSGSSSSVSTSTSCSGVEACQKLCCVQTGSESSDWSSSSSIGSSTSVTCSQFFQDGTCPAGSRGKEASAVKDATCDPRRDCDSKCCTSDDTVRSCSLRYSLRVPVLLNSP